ncbi:fumarylacetoacetase [uncultured Rhodoferax sp.]|uniref:fumarylacetoacetase n=1 Tax=uncultured Rhodoferax sp. TaxID=223188 RepID=UPI0025DC441F|nr:fumarylacetoacetase [uncultured Rhodoferax sp.]
MSAALITLDATHDPAILSWVESANAADTDFPIQNLPFGRFRHNALEPWQIGVAIGDRVLDLHATGLIDHNDMPRLMAAPVAARRALRLAIWEGLRAGSSLQKVWADALLRQTEVELGLPCEVGDYTDFYTGIHHATTVGKLFRPDNPLLPNYQWVPIGYHGRASSIGASGQQFHRPHGQTLAPGASVPSFGPTGRLDYELEMAAWAGMDNALGAPVSIADAEKHIFGLTLLNDWSARDVQAWEYQPLGPFLAKNFATTVSPWLVTMEALAPFRAAFERPKGDPQPLAYLDSAHNRSAGAIDVQLEVWLQTAVMREAGSAGVRLSQSNLRDAYWTLAQLVAHHTVNGCNLRSGDVLGTGTLSGPAPEQGGSLLELTQGGKRALTLANGETRTFLQDGDAIILRGSCQRAGARRIGFGDCRGTVLAARAL